MFETTNEAGHRETVLDLPRPTDRIGLWGLGAPGLPAVVVSWTSLGVTLATFVALQATATLRALFRLPVPPELVALAASAVAVFVAHRCRARPGRSFPRSWCLFLVAASLALAALGWLDRTPEGAPWRHASGLALLAGALALVPRLLRVRPDRRWAEWTGLLAVAGAAGVLVPMLLAGRWAFLQQIDKLDHAMAVLGGWTESVHEIGATDWSRLGRDPAVREEAMATLNGLDPSALPLNRALWETAEALGRDDELAGAMTELSEATVAALSPERAPRVSVLREPAVSWNPGLKEWRAYREFDRASELVGRYHRRLGELYASLRPSAFELEWPEGGSVALQGYREGYRVHGEELRNRLAPELRPWADRWALARVPEAREIDGAVDPPLADVIAGRLGGAGTDQNLVPADVWELMNLALSRARELASETPGCHLRQHREGARDIARFECSAYAPLREEGAEGADLLVEMRVVYADQAGRLTTYHRPSEIFFLFPVPPGTQPDVHLRVVAEAVAQAVADRWSGGFELSDRSGSALHGFVLKSENRALTVYRPWLEPFVKERRVVAVRGEWRSP